MKIEVYADTDSVAREAARFVATQESSDCRSRLVCDGGQRRLKAKGKWRKRVRVERTDDIEDATRRF